MADKPKAETTDPKENDPIRPLPDAPRSKADRDKIRIFALVVGINKYQNGVPPLSGCVNDANLVADYLREQYGSTDEKLKKKDSLAPIDPAKPNEAIAVEKFYKDADQKQLSLQLCILLDEQATYENIIHAIENHLVNNPDATAHDSFWFHFSGHGAEMYTAKAFYKPEDGSTPLVPDGKDQVLVCYNGDKTNTFFMADKEIGVMLEKIHENVRAKSDEKPHVLVTLDCCHSGSGTRDFMEPQEFKTRNAELFTSRTWEDAMQEQNAIRKIESYYKNVFGEKGAYIPQSQHLLISACDNTEKAGDSPSGGVFTTNLVNVLRSKANGEINYTDVFTQTRARAKARRPKQTVQFEPVDGFNPYVAFLEGWALGEEQLKYEVRSKTIKRRGKENVIWTIHAGAINGLPSKEEEKGKIQLQIYSNLSNEMVGNAVVTVVGMQDSAIKLEEGLTLKTLESQQGEAEVETYYARLFTLPVAPEYIHLDGSENEALIQSLSEKWEDEADGNLKNLNIIPITTLEGAEQPSVIVKATTAGGLVVTDAKDGRKWFTQPSATAQITLFKSNLAKLIRWIRFLKLDNNESKLLNEFDMELVVGDWSANDAAGSPSAEDDQEAFKKTMLNTYSGAEVKIYGSEEKTFFLDEDEFGNINNYWLPHFIRFHYKKPEQERYFYVFGMQSDGTILFFDSRFNNKIESTKEGQVIDYIGKQINSFDLEPGQTQADFWFKIFVTVDPIDPALLTQEPFADTRSGEFGKARGGSSTADKWACLTMKVKVAFQTEELTPDSEAAPIGEEGKITIEIPEGSSLKKARASLVSAETDSRSLDPASRLAEFEKAGLSMLNFGGTRAVKSDNILELTDFEAPVPQIEEKVIDGETVREVKPIMNITLDTGISDSELAQEDGEIVDSFMPLAFDGQHFKVVGDLTTASSTATIPIRELPPIQASVGQDDTPIENPFGSQEGDRSLFGALKMAFFRLTLKKNNINKLRWVEIRKNGTVARTDTGIDQRVKKAKKILLVIHGIIGDTETIIEPVANLLELKTSSEDSDFLMLTYDYENLTESIAKIAERFKAALEEVGLTEGHGKELTILAHSMGGLVSRQFIEQLGGNKVVNHLVMAGTPNNGSPFGKIEGARAWAVRFLELSANFAPNLIPFSGYILKGLQGATKVFKTLGEMDPKSDFLKTLNNSDDPGIKYSILAGDTNGYDVPGEGFGKFMENLTLRVGDIANSKDAHDIAVAVDSIENKGVFSIREPKPVTPDEAIVCHHLNYFVNDASRVRLKELLDLN